MLYKILSTSLFLFVGCIQFEAPEELSNESSSSTSVSTPKNKSFNQSRNLGYVNLIARKKVDLKRLKEVERGFEKIKFISGGETILMSESEFFNQDGVVDIAMPGHNKRVEVTIFYSNGEVKNLDI